MAGESAGQYCLGRGDKSLADDYFLRAAKDFADYGALAKCSHIEKKYTLDFSAPFTLQDAARRSSFFMQPTTLEIPKVIV